MEDVVQGFGQQWKSRFKPCTHYHEKWDMSQPEMHRNRPMQTTEVLVVIIIRW